MATPTPLTVDGSGPKGAIPVSISGLEDGAVQTATQTTATAISPGSATNVQGILAELAVRIKALEDASA